MALYILLVLYNIVLVLMKTGALIDLLIHLCFTDYQRFVGYLKIEKFSVRI